MRVSALRNRIAQAWTLSGQRPRNASVYRLSPLNYPTSGPAVGFSLGSRRTLYSIVFLVPDAARTLAREVRALSEGDANGNGASEPRVIARKPDGDVQLTHLLGLVGGKPKWADECAVRPNGSSDGTSLVIELGSRDGNEAHATLAVSGDTGRLIAERLERAASVAESLPTSRVRAVA